MDDPAVPNSAVVQLMPADIPSRLEHAAQARALLFSPMGIPISEPWRLSRQCFVPGRLES
ncbi:hypothetical protein CSQ91_27320 [Janthinobacterium sp. BJB301]|nr:hypothetical protein CSQ91_27320 [Janthinobacterium sp. BJB301]